jgi:hypothetical protein
MGYTIEVSFDILKHSNISELKKTIVDHALDLNCDNYYYYYDMDGMVKIPRNHCIIAINFLEEETFNCAKFIKKIKKMPNIHIECIYEDDIACKLIYASNFYLKNVDKSKVVVYNKFKRERGYSDNEKYILNEIKK